MTESAECVEQLGLGKFAYNLDSQGIYSGLFFVLIPLVYLILTVHLNKRIPCTKCTNVPERFVFGTLVFIVLLGVTVVQAIAIPVAYHCRNVQSTGPGDYKAMWICYGLITGNLILISCCAWCNLLINLWRGSEGEPHLNIFIVQVTMARVVWMPVLFMFKGLVEIVKGAQYCCCARESKRKDNADVEMGHTAGHARARSNNNGSEAVRRESSSTTTRNDEAPPQYTASTAT